MLRLSPCFVLLVLVLSSRTGVAEQGDAAHLQFFEERIRPVLVSHCYECHSAEAKELQGELRLDSRAGIEQGGPSGPLVVPGEPDESLLLSALRYEDLQMPPQGKLPDAVLRDFERWISLGAPDPRVGDGLTQPPPMDVEEGRKFWSFQTPRRAPPPSVQDTSWPWNEIDRFILAKLEAAKLHPVGDADKRTRLRRLYTDLTGLPPRPDQIRDFLDDETADAWPRLVDRLLASPAFGVRWGRHWLDVVRYSDSSGGGRTRIFADAWRYRDYVVNALNADKPYDEFITEQIAGDLLGHETIEQGAEQLTATGFLAIGPINYELQDKELLDMEVVDEQLDTLGRAILGMTIGCARCHDHKFDPIPTRDYYAMAGIFRSTKTLEHANVSDPVMRQLPVAADWRRELDEFAGKESQLRAKLAAAGRELGQLTGTTVPGGKAIEPKSLPGIVVDDTQAELEGNWVRSTSTPRFVGAGYLHDGATDKGGRSIRFRPPLPDDGEYEVRVAYAAGTNRAPNVDVQVIHAGGRTSIAIDQRQTPPIDGLFRSLGRFAFRAGSAVVEISNANTSQHVIVDAVQFLPAGERLAGGGDDDDAAAPAAEESAARIAALKRDLGRWESELSALLASAPPPQPRVYSVSESETPGDAFICIRGNVHNPGEVVPRGFLQVADWQSAWEIPDHASGRSELAKWLCRADHPLTGRVLVNRLWQHLLGQGLVDTPDNFGRTGRPPTHPELLDYLAVRFVEQGWSIKQLVRSIVLSRVYALSSEATDSLVKADVENRLLGRTHRRRLDAEVIRDAMLLASGELDQRLGGPTVKPGTTSEFGYDFTSRRRSVYVPVFRNAPVDVFEVFDAADPNIVMGRRTPSTRPTQALFLMNSPFVTEQAGRIADRILDAPATSVLERLRLAGELILSRPPTAAEARLTERFVMEMRNRSAPPRSERELWTSVCQALLACLDSRYLK